MSLQKVLIAVGLIIRATLQGTLAYDINISFDPSSNMVGPETEFSPFSLSLQHVLTDLNKNKTPPWNVLSSLPLSVEHAPTGTLPTNVYDFLPATHLYHKHMILRKMTSTLVQDRYPMPAKQAQPKQTGLPHTVADSMESAYGRHVHPIPPLYA